MDGVKTVCILTSAIALAGCGNGTQEVKADTAIEPVVVSSLYTPKPPSPEIALLAARVSSLEVTVQALDVAGQRASQPMLAPPPGTTAAAQLPPGRPRDDLDPDQGSAQPLAQLQRDFYAEPADQRWAPSARAGLTRTLEEVAPAGMNSQVECRSRSCRIAVAGQPNDDHSWQHALAIKLSDGFATVRTLVSEGGFVLFVAN